MLHCPCNDAGESRPLDRAPGCSHLSPSSYIQPPQHYFLLIQKIKFPDNVTSQPSACVSPCMVNTAPPDAVLRKHRPVTRPTCRCTRTTQQQLNKDLHKHPWRCVKWRAMSARDLHAATFARGTSRIQAPAPPLCSLTINHFQFGFGELRNTTQNNNVTRHRSHVKLSRFTQRVTCHEAAVHMKRNRRARTSPATQWAPSAQSRLPL
jgi:hypothetical protein